VSTRPRLSEWESTWAFVAGGGLALIILAFALSAVRGPEGTNNLSGMMVIGVLLLISGTAGWMIQFRPWTQFDDQSTPLFTGHEDHHAHEPEGSAAYPPAPPVIVDPMNAFPPAESGHEDHSSGTADAHAAH
jgi:hypothetical protein